MISKRTCILSTLVMLSIAVVPAAMVALHNASPEESEAAPATVTSPAPPSRAKVAAPMQTVVLDEIRIVAPRVALTPRRGLTKPAQVAAEDTPTQKTSVCAEARPVLAGHDARAARPSFVRECDVLDVADAPDPTSQPEPATPRETRAGRLEFDFDPSAPGRSL